VIVCAGLTIRASTTSSVFFMGKRLMGAKPKDKSYHSSADSFRHLELKHVLRNRLSRTVPYFCAKLVASGLCSLPLHGADSFDGVFGEGKLPLTGALLVTFSIHNSPADAGLRKCLPSVIDRPHIAAERLALFPRIPIIFK